MKWFLKRMREPSSAAGAAAVIVAAGQTFGLPTEMVTGLAGLLGALAVFLRDPANPA